MNRSISILTAGVLALSLSGLALAADEKAPEPTSAPRTQDPAAVPADQTEQDQDYLADIKKCEKLQDVAKEKCIEQARQKYNRM